MLLGMRFKTHISSPFHSTTGLDFLVTSACWVKPMGWRKPTEILASTQDWQCSLGYTPGGGVQTPGLKSWAPPDWLHLGLLPYLYKVKGSACSDSQQPLNLPIINSSHPPNGRNRKGPSLRGLLWPALLPSHQDRTEQGFGVHELSVSLL